MYFKYLLNQIIKILIPPTCYGCSDIVPQKNQLCLLCLEKMEYINYPFCKICYYPYKNKKEITNDCCLHFVPYIQKISSICCYNKICKKIIDQYKNKDQIFIGKKIAFAMIPLIKKDFSDLTIISNVATNKQSMNKRMYNQSAIIAKNIYKILKTNNNKIQFIPDLINKIKITKKQSSLSKAERLLNLQGSFEFNKKHKLASSDVVLLIDDIITTGATIIESGKTIKEHNENIKIYAASFARTLL